MATQRHKPIGMFDSGVGGLTVLREVQHTLPKESVVYFGDTARIPYGEKSPETVIRYSIENTRFLLEHAIKALVIPCNTATAHAIDKLKDLLDIPVIGVIEPGAEKAVSLSKHGRIGVLGTRGTIYSEVYQREIVKRMPGAEVTAIACPLFVPFVEENFRHPALQLIVKEYLQPLREKRVDTLLLGCTHYPLLQDLIQREVGEHVAIVDSASTCAEALAGILKSFDIQQTSANQPNYQFFVSDDPHKFQKNGSLFLGAAIPFVSLKTFG